MASPAHKHPALLESVFESSPDGVLVYRLIRDHRGNPAKFRRTIANAAALKLLSLPEADVLERAMPDLPTNDLFDEYTSVATRGHTICFNKVVEDGAGEIIVAYQIEANAVDDGLLVRISDVTIRLRQTRSATQQTERLQKLARRSHDLLAITRADGQIVTMLGAVSDVLGQEPGELIGKNLMNLVHRDERHLLAEGHSLRGEGQLRVRQVPGDDGATRWLEIKLERDGLNRLAVLRDITVLHSLEERVAKLTPETSADGVSTREAFLSRFEQELARRQRYGRLTAVAVVALDQQKGLAKKYGPEGLDRARRAVAEAAIALLRTVDLVAHWSDEALVFLLPETPVKGGMRACERLGERLRDSVVEFDGKALPITISCGLTGIDADDNARAVLSRASRAINRARKSGLGQIVVSNAIDEG